MSSALYPSATTYPGATTYPDPPDGTIMHAYYSTSGGGSWEDATTQLRAFSTSRGRETELADVDAGTASITVGNPARTFDPLFNTAIKPMNRWWLWLEIGGVSEDLYVGYAESYAQQWVKGSEDAATVVSCADEFKVLALDKLPVTDPPRDSYADVVLFDEPQGYWRMQDTELIKMAAAAGSAGLTSGSVSRVQSPIVGDWPVDVVAGTAYGARSTTERIYTYDSSTLLPGLDVGGPGDAAGLSSFVFETWFRSSEATPSVLRTIVTGPFSTASGGVQYGINLQTDGKLYGYARNSSGTANLATAATAITADTWYYLALVVTGTNTLLYIDGVQAATAVFSGSIGVMDADEFMYLGTATAVGGARYYDEPAFYRTSLTAARILAHYNAGVNRGFATTNPHSRIDAVLDSVGNSTPRNIPFTENKQMTPTFMRGQSPLEELRQAENAEAGNAVLFIGKDGAITFLAGNHRAFSPWADVQATFDDDGTDFPYFDIGLDYSDSFIANEWNVTRTGGTLVTVSDAASIEDYGHRPQPLTDLPLTTDADVATIAAALLAKYKDPMTRVTRLELLPSTTAMQTAVFGCDIGDRIRVLRTPPGGGARIDQVVFIQKISIDGTPGRPLRVVWGLSPL